MDDRTELSGIDRAIAEALAIDVSPDFHARVRQRIANVPMGRRSWQRWLVVPAAAASGLAAAALLVVTMMQGAEPSPLPARPLSVGRWHPVVGSAPVLSVATRRREPAARAGIAVAARVPAEPEVLVPREEIEMYRRLVAAAQQLPPAFIVEGPRDIVPPQAVSQIAIDPIRIDLIAPPVGGEGDRQ